MAGDKEAETRVALLTPIVKAWCTDRGVDCASLGIQVHGGMGFVEDTGAAQVLRDARIAPIYEGHQRHPGDRPRGPQGAARRRAPR
jgi:alkylation response protein AidB-like acyl-CoA dehydrogenase